MHLPPPQYLLICQPNTESHTPLCVILIWYCTCALNESNACWTFTKVCCLQNDFWQWVSRYFRFFFILLLHLKFLWLQYFRPMANRLCASTQQESVTFPSHLLPFRTAVETSIICSYTTPTSTSAASSDWMPCAVQPARFCVTSTLLCSCDNRIFRESCGRRHRLC